MILSDVSIKRPVFATMMISAIVVFGLASYRFIGLDMLPNVDAPVATVTTIYPGADPETVESEVSKPIEEAVSNVSGLKRLRSISVENVSQVVIEFELEVDSAIAVQDVRDQVGRIIPLLPADVETPTVAKLDLGSTPILTLAVSGPASVDEVTHFARKRIKEPLQTVPGVGSVEIIGGQEREVKVWLDPGRLEATGLTVMDVVGAIAANNVDFPGGRLSTGSTETTVKVRGRFTSSREIEGLAIMEMSGRAIRVGDVARIEEGLEERRTAALLNGEPAVTVLVRKQSGTNSVAVADEAVATLSQLRADFPAGWSAEVVIDGTTFTRASFEHVQFDLVFGALLAVLVVFLFLRNGRSTLVAAVAIPTSVIGTFTFIGIMGFTFNTLTLLALALSIGILIDDAIVVLENIYRHIEEGKPRRQAAAFATSEIGLAVLATTLSIVAVFVPVAFMRGMVGKMFYEFGLTVAVAVLISLFVSFTLTPMLCSRYLEPGGDNAFYRFLEGALQKLDAGYRRLIAGALARRWQTLAIAVLVFVLGVGGAQLLDTEMLTPTDQSELNVFLETPIGTSLAATEKVARDISSRIRAYDIVSTTVTTIGADTQKTQNRAKIYVKLVPKNERRVSQFDLMAKLRQDLAGIDGVEAWVEEIGIMGHLTAAAGVRMAQLMFTVRGDNLDELSSWAEKLANELNNQPGFVGLDSTYEGGKPEVQVRIDRDRAANLGVVTAAVGQTLNALVGGVEASKLRVGGEDFPIRVRLEASARQRAEQIKRLKVRATSGAAVDLGNVVNIEPGVGPSQIDREDRMRTVTVMGSLEEDMPLGAAIKIVRSVGERLLPAGIMLKIVGIAQEMESSFASMFFALFLAVIIIYMILASQFDSFIHPFTIMMALPLSLPGALGALLLTGRPLSLFAMIGLIMLMGLVTKNAILLVDYTNVLRRRDGMERRAALLAACPTRLRPILMTTAAMVFGMLPTALSHGYGAELRAPMAICVIGGLLVSTLLTLVVVPVIYTLLDDVSRRITRRRPSQPAKEVAA